MMIWNDLKLLGIRAYSGRGLVLIAAVGRSDSPQWSAYIDITEPVYELNLCLAEVIQWGSNLDQATAIAIFPALDPDQYVQVREVSHIDEEIG